MTTLITADLHLADNSRDSYRHKFMQTTLPSLIKQHKVSLFIVLGDLTEDKANFSAWLVNTIADHFQKLSEKVDVIIKRGNHDYLNPEFPFYRFLSHIPNITWINEPFATPLPDMGKCLFLPHTNNYKRDWQTFDMAKFNWIFAHNTFAGSIGDSGFKLDGIPINVFPEDAKVISGDVHKPQVNGPVTYVGAPYTVDFGDDFEPRVLLIDKGKLKSIPVPGVQKRLIEFDLLKATSVEANKGDILKVRVVCKASQMDKWPEIKSEVRAWGDKHGYIINSIIPKVDNTSSRMSMGKAAHSSKTDEQVLREYATQRAVGKGFLDTGLELLNGESK